MGWLLALALLAVMTRAPRGAPARQRAGGRATAPAGPKVPSRRTDPTPGLPPYARSRFVAFSRRVAAAYAAAGAAPLQAAMLAAHSALAIGWGRNVWNWNIGVLRAGASYTGPWAGVDTREWDPITRTYNRGLPGADPWRAYDSLEASAADVLRQLRASRYRRARELLDAGDVRWFAELGRAGWYTEPPERHLPRYRAVLARVRRSLQTP